MIEYVAYLLIFGLTLAGVEVYRRWSLRRNLLDIPNERSSHAKPTPRGGGVVFVVVALITLLLFDWMGTVGLPWQFFAGALIVGTISLFDDLWSISPFVRLFCHSAAAALVLTSGVAFTKISLPFAGALYLGSVSGGILGFLWIVWLINAYNFMDGIDGIAALQAVIAGVGWFLYGNLLGLETASFIGGVFASTTLGFLILNWQPAKIFMGDVGSAFLGYGFAVIPLMGAKATDGASVEGQIFLVGLVFVWPFVADSVYTFMRRLLRGERVWMAHREHIYQRMVIGGASHASVTVFYGLLASSMMAVVVVTVFFWHLADMTVVSGALACGIVVLAFNRRICGFLTEETDAG